jgi:hypothetical protein
LYLHMRTYNGEEVLMLKKLVYASV